MLACLNGNDIIAKMLLKNGANPNKLDISLNNCLDYALLAQ